jgi:hypothetical protein
MVNCYCLEVTLSIVRLTKLIIEMPPCYMDSLLLHVAERPVLLTMLEESHGWNSDPEIPLEQIFLSYTRCTARATA